MKTKNDIWFYALSIIGTFLVFASSCDNDLTQNVPVLATNEVSITTQISAMSGGTITSDGGSTVIGRGVCWSTNASPTIADSKTKDSSGIGSFTSNLIGLTVNTKYYVRSYATNILGTGYGNTISFTTHQKVTDIDGNNYNIVSIGSQVWMTENLKVTTFNDGETIPLITDNTEWMNLSTPAYCWYDNDEVAYKNIYGALYNWYAVEGKLCPTGWHVPSDVEWTELTDYLGGKSIAGGKLKEAGYTHWNSPNTAATNETGFAALPAGVRHSYGPFSNIGHYGYWWSNTKRQTFYAWSYWVEDSSSNTYRTAVTKELGLQVRCVMD